MPVKCPIREPSPSTSTVRIRTPQSGPVTRPVFPFDLDRELKLRDATNEVRDAYDRYQYSLAKLRALGGPKSDPSIDATQIQFPFADQYVTVHSSIYQPNPALYGPWSSRLRATDMQMPEPQRTSLVPTPPECRSCLTKIIPPAPHRALRAKSADDRMAAIFAEIHKGDDALAAKE